MLPACIGTRSQAACTFRSGRWRGSRMLLNSRQARPLRHLVLRPCAARNPLEESLSKGDNINVNLRSEAEAPWRCNHDGTEVAKSAFLIGHGSADAIPRSTHTIKGTRQADVAFAAAHRSLRLVMFSFFCLSATVGAVIATVQVVSALRGAEDALPLQDVATVSIMLGLA